MTTDGPKNACSAKWCDVCAEMDRKKREAPPTETEEPDMATCGKCGTKFILSHQCAPKPQTSGQRRNARLSNPATRRTRNGRIIP